MFVESGSARSERGGGGGRGGCGGVGEYGEPRETRGTKRGALMNWDESAFKSVISLQDPLEKKAGRFVEVGSDEAARALRALGRSSRLRQSPLAKMLILR